MIIDALGLILNIIAIGITSLWITVALFSMLASFGFQYFNTFTASSRVNLLWVVVLLPWAVAVISIVLLLAPEFYQPKLDWLSVYIHWHHAYIFHLFSWHGALIMIFSASFMVVSLSKFIGAMRTSSKLNQLDYFSVTKQLDVGILLIDSEKSQAFTAGLLRPRSYITTGLQNRLSEESLAAVQQHELAHQHRRDPLRKYVFSLFTSFFPRVIGTRLNAAFSLSIEQVADQAALRVIKDKPLLSQTILDVVRLNGGSNGSMTLSTVDCGFTSHEIRQRIHYLLKAEPTKQFPYFGLIIFTTAIIAINTLSVDFFHHSVEALFSH